MALAQPQVAADEVAPLNNNPVSVEGQNDNICLQVICNTAECAASCCRNRHYRILAISSIIFGISCIGIVSLINSVKAEDAESAGQRAEVHSKKAKKFAIISIVTWFTLIILTLGLMALISYLLTLKD